MAARGPGMFQEWIDWKYLQEMLMAVVSLGVLHFSRDRSAKILYYLAGVGPLFFSTFYFSRRRPVCDCICGAKAFLRLEPCSDGCIC